MIILLKFSSTEERGFTLLELIVVMAIISIITAIVLPRVGNSLSNLELNASARYTASSLRYASSRAMSEKKAYLALFDESEGRLVIYPINLNVEKLTETVGEDKDPANETMSYLLPDGIRFEITDTKDTSPGTHKFRIYFFENGTSSGGKIILANKKNKRYELDVDIITSQVTIKRVNIQN